MQYKFIQGVKPLLNISKVIKARVSIVLALLLLPTIVVAEEIDSGDTAWLLTSTALVLFMTIPGLSLFYAGLVRKKNVLSVLMNCFTITCLASLVWIIIGYSLAFSDGGALNAWIGGLSNMFLDGVSRSSLSGTIPETVFVMFQMTFIIITPALVVGAFVERMKFSAMILFSLFWMVLVYLPICHQVWGGGWLAEKGLMDFAGGTVVHLTAGVGALVTAVVLGARDNFPSNVPPHNLTMSVTGAGMLWVGWFGFNAGSAVAANADAGMAMLVTQISAATASLVWMFAEWIKFGKPSVLGIVTGMIAGLGAITPASGYVGPMGAVLIGLLAGSSCFLATQFIKRVLKIDDSLDVFPVHGVGGIIGTLSVAIFASEYFGGIGLGDVSVGEQFMTQLIGVVFVLIWTAVVTYIILKMVNLVVPLRVDKKKETEGLDISEHEEEGYLF